MLSWVGAVLYGSRATSHNGRVGPTNRLPRPEVCKGVRAFWLRRAPLNHPQQIFAREQAARLPKHRLMETPRRLDSKIQITTAAENRKITPHRTKTRHTAVTHPTETNSAPCLRAKVAPRHACDRCSSDTSTQHLTPWGFNQRTTRAGGRAPYGRGCACVAPHARLSIPREAQT